MNPLSKILIGLGVALVLAGLIYSFLGDKLGWIGHLPGDLSIERENFRFYFPFTTLVLLNAVIWLSAKCIAWIRA